ncbi:MAG: DUF2141 domain-containing protein [Bacteroidia bacterium]|nr:DUF2141 domain-containing protein [Bacteroidia bacterium]
MFLVLCLNQRLAIAQNLEVVFSGIRSNLGQIVLSVYTNEQGFDKDIPLKRLTYKKTQLKNGEITVTLNLPPGTYGLAMMDDENNNNEMNYNMFGIPKEGFGFSNYYLTGLFKPKFEVFKFTVLKDQKQKVQMKIRYM